MDAMTSADIVRLFDTWEVLFANEREYLISLDAQVGDSDLGITMSKAFSAAAAALRGAESSADVGSLLRTAGATIARTAPSTMGTLMATGFLRAGKALEGRTSVDAAGAAAFWRAFRDGVAERGKAKVGDKTLLDVLDPIAATLEARVAAGAGLVAALAAAANLARDALRATMSLVAQHGKAAAFQSKTIGLQDAGATVGVLIIESMAQFAAE